MIKWRDLSEETQRLHLLDEISYKWREIGEIVGMSHSVLETTMEKKNNDPKECCRAVLSQWLSNPPPDYPATWQGLIELLKDSQLCKVASDLNELVKKAQN